MILCYGSQSRRKQYTCYSSFLFAKSADQFPYLQISTQILLPLRSPDSSRQSKNLTLNTPIYTHTHTQIGKPPQIISSKKFLHSCQCFFPCLKNIFVLKYFKQLKKRTCYTILSNLNILMQLHQLLGRKHIRSPVYPPQFHQHFLPWDDRAVTHTHHSNT